MRGEGIAGVGRPWQPTKQSRRTGSADAGTRSAGDGHESAPHGIGRVTGQPRADRASQQVGLVQDSRRPLRRVPASEMAGMLPEICAATRAVGGPAYLPVPDANETVAASGADASDGAGETQLVPEPVAVVIETSGSMSAPKRVMLSARALLAGAAATYGYFDALRAGTDPAAADAAALATANDQGSRQWLLTLPEHYIAGLQVTVRAFAANTAPVRYDEAHFAVESFCALAETMTGDRRYVSLVPVQLGRLLDDLHTERVDTVMRRFEAILVGGQAIPAPMRRAAKLRGWPVIATYGSSETAGGVVYDGYPLPWVHLREVDGELQIASPTLAEGYLGDPERTAARFITDADGTRWYRTGDAGRINEDGSVTVTGRLDNVIISGGVKVDLDELERAAAAAIVGGEVAVVAIADAQWGQRVAVTYAAGSGLGADAAQPTACAEVPDDARDRIRTALEPFGVAARPAHWLYLPELPRLASGKPDRKRCAHLAQADYDRTRSRADETSPA